VSSARIAAPLFYFPSFHLSNILFPPFGPEAKSCVLGFAEGICFFFIRTVRFFSGPPRTSSGPPPSAPLCLLPRVVLTGVANTPFYCPNSFVWSGNRPLPSLCLPPTTPQHLLLPPFYCIYFCVEKQPLVRFRFCLRGGSVGVSGGPGIFLSPL